MGNDLLFWVGEERSPIVRDRSSDLVMDSVIHYYRAESPRVSYSFNQLFLDNGAFTAATQGVELDIEKVISVQETIWPDKTIPLDYPFRPGMTISQVRKNWEKTKKNVTYWQESTTLKKRLVVALHAWDKTSLKGNIAWLQKHADTDFLALGSVIDFEKFDGFFGDRQPRKALIDSLSLALEVIKSNSDFRIHIMGFGSSPLMLNMAYYLGAESTDSSGCRRKAAFGKIVLPGTGERYCGNSSAKFGLSSFSENDLEKLRECDCSICVVNQDLLWADWKARAIHNEHVMKKEVDVAQTLMAQGRDIFESHLERMFARSSLRHLWEYAKLRAHYHRISDLLFQR